MAQRLAYIPDSLDGMSLEGKPWVWFQTRQFLFCAWKKKWRLPTAYLLISVLLEPARCTWCMDWVYGLTTMTEETCQFFHLSKLKLTVVFDKFIHGNNFKSKQIQRPPFMTTSPGHLKVEFVYWRIGAPSQPSSCWALIGPWVWARLHFTKSNPNLGKELVTPSLLGDYLIA